MWYEGALCRWHSVSGLYQYQHQGCDVVLVLQDVTKRGAGPGAHRIPLGSSLQLRGNLQLSQNSKVNFLLSHRTVLSEATPDEVASYPPVALSRRHMDYGE